MKIQFRQIQESKLWSHPHSFQSVRVAACLSKWPFDEAPIAQEVDCMLILNVSSKCLSKEKRQQL